MCNPTDAVVKVVFSPKYVFTGEANPAPTSVSGNSLTWNLNALSFRNPAKIYYRVENSPITGHLFKGDTVNSCYTITPTAGDMNPADNNRCIWDTVTSSYDPNEMLVSPGGYISAGTQLKYTINFENTGNDTAFNISVYDTLSDNVDVKSLNIIMATAAMNIAVFNDAGHNIVKFDFPNINLQDSSHHDQCDGGVVFTVNAKEGLASGTTIFNHAGIFFDYNPVVMTDTVENIIALTSLAAIGNSGSASIYPNPANEVLTVKMDNDAYNTLSITNTMGQHIMTLGINNVVSTVNVKALPAGMYYITLKGDSGVKVMKFEKL